MSRIVLTGFRGTGKSTVARLLSDQLGLPCVDTDLLVEENAGLTIAGIFARGGEKEFRALEHTVIQTLSSRDSVIATGGGAVLDPVNIASLRKDSLMVYLDADPMDITERIRISDRPPLTPLTGSAEVLALLSQRRMAYCRSHDISIDTRNLSPEEVVARIQSHLSGGTAERDVRDARMHLESRIGASEALLTHQDISTKGRISFPDRLYAVIGNPSRHSQSPRLFSALFLKYGIPAFYVDLEPSGIGEIWKYLKTAGVRGLSVTIPFKQAVIPFLDEISGEATAIGAVNTVLFCQGKTYGLNTDWEGIAGAIGKGSPGTVLVIGAGGAAAAAVYAALFLGNRVIVANRTKDRAILLADRIGAEVIDFEDMDTVPADTIINATPVGMGNGDEQVVPDILLTPGVTVFDLVYTPPRTALIQRAEAAGCRVIMGTELFIRQACAQFYHFTGIRLDYEEARRILV